MKATEALKRMTSSEPGNYVLEDYQMIEKNLKALEIIKTKNVDILWFKCCKTYMRYNSNLSYQSKPLSKQEFELLCNVIL